MAQNNQDDKKTVAKTNQNTLVDIHELQGENLSKLIDEEIYTLSRAKKLGTAKRIELLSKLIKAHADLVKTQRTTSGLDQVSGDINAGVIIIQGKSDNWVDDAKREIKEAKVAQVKDEEHPEPKKEIE